MLIYHLFWCSPGYLELATGERVQAAASLSKGDALCSTTWASELHGATMDGSCRIMPNHSELGLEASAPFLRICEKRESPEICDFCPVRNGPVRNFDSLRPIPEGKFPRQARLSFGVRRFAAAVSCTARGVGAAAGSSCEVRKLSSIIWGWESSLCVSVCL